MGKIFYVMGKSASGKDTIYKELRERIPELKTVVLYTTRPIRDGETEGVEYHFTTVERLDDFRREKRLRNGRIRRCMDRGVILPWMTGRSVWMTGILI